MNVMLERVYIYTTGNLIDKKISMNNDLLIIDIKDR